jgi:hypothetical protein
MSLWGRGADPETRPYIYIYIYIVANSVMLHVLL